MLRYMLLKDKFIHVNVLKIFLFYIEVSKLASGYILYTRLTSLQRGKALNEYP